MARVVVISGFLESGKTTLIRRLLEEGFLRECGGVLILQCERGAEVLEPSLLRNEDAVVRTIGGKQELTARLLGQMERDLHPDLVLIEYNGTWPIEFLLSIRLPTSWKMGRIIFCADASSFDFYLKNTGGLVANQLSGSDAVLFNRLGQNTDSLKIGVRNLNRTAEIVLGGAEEKTLLRQLFASGRFRRKRGPAGLPAVLAAVVCVAALFPASASIPGFYAALQSINMVFLGILMQAVPFLLIGSFLSAFLQEYVPDEALVRLFTRCKWLGMPLAILLGFFFPVCDCGIVPIASRLARKGVPLPMAMTFMLAAPAVSPVTILSTLYAFPGQPKYVLFRIFVGVLVAVAAGLVLTLMCQRGEDFLLPGATEASCACGVAGVAAGPFRRFGRPVNVLTNAGQEFLGMGRYVVLGALICAVLQQAVSASFFQQAGGAALVSVLVMLLAAFFMSVCSTANAFIGRGFLNLFPPYAVLAFIVMGPMLDFSNLLMLGGSFRKKFVLRLTGVLVVIGLAIFTLLSVLSGGKR